MYEERAAAVPGVTLWTRENGGGSYRVLPDGCMDLIWHDGRLLIAGPDTRAYLADDPPGGSYAGLRFAPGLGPLMLGVPARELRDQRVPLDALWPAARAGRLADRAGGTDAAAVLEAWVVARTGTAGPVDRLPFVVARELAAGRPVAGIAAGARLGERQLRRRCEAAFGYGPKTLGRVLRMQRALELARRGTAFADVAVRAGYADQAHLSREVKALAGVPLGRLVAPAPAPSAEAPVTRR
ncbi:helix-turn-helix domain-containing protein [Actinacidiphila alni]|uniref:helix-turn-helix domain-containing protein n=1 Tax=Actinacidiphila alni TaxID=380248 RepID=UPI003455A481